MIKIEHLSETVARSQRLPPEADRQVRTTEAVPPPFSANSRAIVRAIDVVGATFVFLMLCPLVLSVAALVRLTSSGSVIFWQWRVGEGGDLFEMLKFRTPLGGARAEIMVDPEDLEAYKQSHFTLDQDDPRITRVGRFLRRVSLDELPRLVNIARGEMSLVGVRPIEPEQLCLRYLVARVSTSSREYGRPKADQRLATRRGWSCSVDTLKDVQSCQT